MQMVIRITAVAALVIAAACSSSGTTYTSDMMAAMLSANRWQGDLRSPSNSQFIGGDVRLERYGSDSSLVSVFMVGADTASSYPWRVHQNECTTQTGRHILNYTFKPIKVSSSPDPAQPTYGSSSAIIPIRMPTQGAYSVEVLAPGTTDLMSDDAVVIACGQLYPVVK